MKDHEEFRPFVSRRYFAAIYVRIPVPKELTTEEELIAFTQAATLGRFKCVLALAPGKAIWFNEKGEITGRDEKDAQLPQARPDIGKLLS